MPYHLRFVWDGRPFDGRHVLVRCYHGLGDTLQFVRFLPALRRRVARLTLETQPELVPLLRDFPGIDRLVPFDVAAPLPPAQCCFEIMELAHALRLPPSAVPPPYLAVPDERAALRHWLGNAPTIGICTRGGAWDRSRWLPAEVLARVLPAGVRIVQLQSQPCGLATLNPHEPCTDVVRTAALVCAVDRVVTMDSMIAHLAGALGRPVCLLLKHGADWRWMDGRDDSPWYPSMRLFRQAAPGRWDEALSALARFLQDGGYTST